MDTSDGKISVYFSQLELNLEEIKLKNSEDGTINRRSCFGSQRSNNKIQDLLSTGSEGMATCSKERQFFFSIMQEDTTVEEISIEEFLGDSKARLKVYFCGAKFSPSWCRMMWTFDSAIFSDLMTVCLSTVREEPTYFIFFTASVYDRIMQYVLTKCFFLLFPPHLKLYILTSFCVEIIE